MVISFSKRDKNSFDSRLKDCDGKIEKKDAGFLSKKRLFWRKAEGISEIVVEFREKNW
ncbi:MAG: hypothetical protein ISS41_06255 [Candidatus Aminicenantes bacterium]|nr:hypothetical protein [Candidatus Aminicenantes bacterium]MBL7083216.1 hypothetical protein [Candidatus Aminicenantes bacterium]